MSYDTLFRESSPLTAEDVEADRRYREALARRYLRGSSVPVNSRDGHPPYPSTWDMQQVRQAQEVAAASPISPSSSCSGAGSQSSSPEINPSLDTEPLLERIPPPGIRVVTNMTPCADCEKPYSPGQVWNILNRAMKRVPNKYARKDWEDANYEGCWASYLRSLTGLELVKKRMDAICSQCILNCISEAQKWPSYDVGRRVWFRSRARSEEVLSA